MSKSLDKNNKLVSSHQNVQTPKNMKSETITVPSVSSASFGGYFILDFKEKNVILQQLQLQFNLSAISGYTANSGLTYPNYSPAWFVFTKIEIALGGVVLDTIYPNEQFILNQLFKADEIRQLTNCAAGNYSSATACLQQRYTLASSASNYYVDLLTLFNHNNIPLLFSNCDLQLRVWTDSYADVIQQGTSTLSGTASASMNFCNLLAKVIRIPSEMQAPMIKEMTSYPHSYKFLDLKTQQLTIQSGTSTASLVLSAINGNASFLFFTIRSGITGTSAYQYVPCYSFSILNSGSQNIVGGVDVLSGLNLQILAKDYVESSYLSETAYGLVNNYANVYTYSFSNDMLQSFATAGNHGSYKMTGSEQLKINFSSATTSLYYVDVYCLTHSILTLSPNSTPIKVDDWA